VSTNKRYNISYIERVSFIRSEMLGTPVRCFKGGLYGMTRSLSIIFPWVIIRYLGWGWIGWCVALCMMIERFWCCVLAMLLGICVSWGLSECGLRRVGFVSGRCIVVGQMESWCLNVMFLISLWELMIYVSATTWAGFGLVGACNNISVSIIYCFCSGRHINMRWL
jgi:hypothetical protein